MGLPETPLFLIRPDHIPLACQWKKKQNKTKSLGNTGRMKLENPTLFDVVA